MNLENKVIVISGGASGIGEGAARYLVNEKGSKVVILDLNEDRGAAIVADLGDDKVLFCKCDVRKEDEIDAAMAVAMAKFGAIHGDINAAGIPGQSRLIDKEGKASSLAYFSKIIDINLKGVYNVMAKCVEQMAKNELDEGGERGVIINISSGAAECGQIGQSSYSASKGGINSMSLPVARELGRIGIRCCAIMPGLIHTPLMDTMPPEFIEGLAKQAEAPKRLGKPEEIAHACAFILENGYMNGRNIMVDAATILQAR
jgi:3-hydroxyacyl-CoA dehydrogenase / 3-hydroxy-2-methylbutyryl-CoA dehydrogenase